MLQIIKNELDNPSLAKPSRLLTLDPSARSTGAALWEARSGAYELLAARRVRPPAGCSALHRAVAVATELRDWLLDLRPPCHCGNTPCAFEGDDYEIPLHLFVSEVPQVRGAGRGKGDPNDLLLMCLVVGAVAEAFSCEEMCDTVTPEWCGSTPKVESGDPRRGVRGARIWERLSPAEQQVLVDSDEMQHDVFDAVGVGLWALGRFARRRGGRAEGAAGEVLERYRKIMRRQAREDLIG